MKSLFASLFVQVFGWWHRQTPGTRLFTWRRGVLVGEDESGNRYYRDRKGSGRRWVIYGGEVEASLVPPGWRAWLHHTVDDTPAEGDYKPRAWEKPHLPNQTGTARAYLPKGSLRRAEAPGAAAEKSYQAWKPE